MALKKQLDVIVIGGGASGMMAAAIASARGKRVLVLEKNSSLGEKLKITGGGRCNITNAEKDLRVFLDKYGNAEPFLHSSFSQFNNQNTFDFFESRGLPLVVQARSRVFPKTERAEDVYKTLLKDLKKNEVIIQTKCSVKKISSKNGNVVRVVTDRGDFSAKSYILATGGLSHKKTGSTGDGFKFLSELGHSIKEPTPAIVPLEVADSWVKILAGVSLPSAKITFFLEGKKQFSKTGEILFTHFGLSGPCILNSAKKVGELLHSGFVTATIDLYPSINSGNLEIKILKIFDSNKNKILRTVVKEFAPSSMSKSVSALTGISLETKVHSVTREERKAIIKLLKALPMSITNLMGFERAVVADGGVELREVDMKTMRSKKYYNLYITGDLLNITRPSGGYSLQLCWTTGYIAGSQA